ncbi:hypothetical protein [Rhodococcus sp. PvR099]|uniref:8-oxoguanine DNA glycosylase OGG fold protein n=1 Tax=Rhodococcus sp. PvR099 TaxID=2806602 RepID=UPI001AEA4544|nr:hypothetical protein [Rhodococcus sp. PvR099]MBP1159819.1 hypothetical protein [Rhodococcus sp. PvR099]
MHFGDEGFEPPDACLQWCRTRSYPLHVLDDGAPVDLDWWNEHLARAGHEIRLRGRDLDGRIVPEGIATVQRNDLRLGSELAETDHAGLGLLFLCAAWQGAHPHRRFKRRFPDVVNPHARVGEDQLARIRSVLDHCARERALPHAASASWSGWPETPGVGVSLLAVYLWAVEARIYGARPQLIEQFGVSTLIHEGWLEDPSVSGFTLRRYDRYVALLNAWAAQANTHPELIEMWLVQRWSARLREARQGALVEPTLF